MMHYIVVEREIDKILIQSAILDKFNGQVTVLVAGRKGSALPLANSIAVARNAPVALVVDAGTENADRIREDELDFQDFVSALPVETPPILVMGIPDIRTALQDENWVDDLLSFLREENYSVSHPFQLRR